MLCQYIFGITILAFMYWEQFWSNFKVAPYSKFALKQTSNRKKVNTKLMSSFKTNANFALGITLLF